MYNKNILLQNIGGVLLRKVSLRYFIILANSLKHYIKGATVWQEKK